MTRKKYSGAAPHTGLAAFAAGAMALALAFGFDLLHLMDRINPIFAKAFSPKGMGGTLLPLNPWILWVGTAALAFSLPAIILHIPGTWRRMVVWVGLLLLTLSWAPVLILASLTPDIGVAVVAVLWSGVCAMFYSANHILPVDASAGKNRKGNDGSH